MDNQIQCGSNLIPDSPYRQVQPGHKHHGFQTGEYISRAVGMGRSQRTIVTRVHGLKHIQRFAATDFAYDNAVRTHTERVLYQVTDGYGALTFNISRAGFQ